jgi:hypothetical protein
VSYDEGMRVRREVLGDEHVDRTLERTTDFTGASRRQLRLRRSAGRPRRNPMTFPVQRRQIERIVPDETKRRRV